MTRFVVRWRVCAHLLAVTLRLFFWPTSLQRRERMALQKLTVTCKFCGDNRWKIGAELITTMGCDIKYQTKAAQTRACMLHNEHTMWRSVLGWVTVDHRGRPSGPSPMIWPSNVDGRIKEEVSNNTLLHKKSYTKWRVFEDYFVIWREVSCRQTFVACMPRNVIWLYMCATRSQWADRSVYQTTHRQTKIPKASF